MPLEVRRRKKEAIFQKKKILIWETVATQNKLVRYCAMDMLRMLLYPVLAQKARRESVVWGPLESSASCCSLYFLRRRSCWLSEEEGEER